MLAFIEAPEDGSLADLLYPRVHQVLRKLLIIESAKAALQRLDEGFFRVRLDRLTPKEREYVFAMASLGNGPYRSSDIADKLGERAQSLGPRRAKIINKGMIYSPAYGDIDFTVPMFADYLKRIAAQTGLPAP